MQEAVLGLLRNPPVNSSVKTKYYQYLEFDLHSNLTICDNTVPGGVPGGGGDLGCGVRGDADVLRWLAIVSVHGDIAAPLLRVGPHLSMIIMVIGNG